MDFVDNTLYANLNPEGPMNYSSDQLNRLNNYLATEGTAKQTLKELFVPGEIVRRTLETRALEREFAELSLPPFGVSRGKQMILAPTLELMKVGPYLMTLGTAYVTIRDFFQ